MGRSRQRRTLLGRKAGAPRKSRKSASSQPQLGRRKSLWRYVGALALAPLAGSAYGQPPVLAPAGPGYGPPGMYAPGQGMYAPGPGMAPPGAMGPMVAPGPMMPQTMTPQNSGGIAIPEADGYSARFSSTTGVGDGLGWDEGYQSFGAWVPLGINSDSMVLYLDARGFMGFDEGGGGNFTLGYRYYMPEYKRFVGIYGGYDVDGGNADSDTFDRFVVGAESVGDIVQYRVNGYVPLDYDGKSAGSPQTGFAEFQNSNIMLFDRSFTRYQYGGVDGEIGGPLPFIGKYGVSGYVGGYYLASDVDDTLGAKLRAEANINDDLQLGAKLTTDEIFDTNVWVTLTMRTPRDGFSSFFRKDWLRPPSASTRMDRGPEREYRVFTDVKTNEIRTLAIDPTDGQPILVLHVDPNGNGGNGTVQNPVNTINGPNNSAYDIIYVGSGEIETQGSIRLFDDQRLLSTAVTHTFDTQTGTYLLPGFTGSSRPVLRNTSPGASPVIQLANNNEVSGFAIDGIGQGGPLTFHDGIVGDRINRFDINRNNFVNVVSGTTITHVGNAVGNVFSNNTVEGVGTPFGTQNGFFMTVVSGVVQDMRVENNVVSNFLGNPGLVTSDGVSIDSGNGLYFRTQNLTQMRNLQINNNTLSENIDGLQLFIEADSIIDANVANNDISNNLDDGIELSESRTTPDFDFGGIGGIWENNRIVNNDGNGINSGAATGPRDLETGEPLSNLIVRRNVINDNGLAGVLINGAGTARYANNIVRRNGEFLLDPSFGAGFDIQERGFKELELVNNLIEDNFGDGVEIDNGTLTPFIITMDGNRIADNQGRGIDVLNRGNAFSAISIINNTIEFNRREGVYVVNTAAFGQTQNGLGIAGVSEFTNYSDATHGMAADGGVFNSPFMFLDVSGNSITANGTAGLGLDQGQGLVIRVGTSGGGDTFASTGFSGVIANVSDNFFGGHLGSDIYVESFTSTVDPVTTSATAFQPDPLARLDLTFLGNEFDPQSPGGDFNNAGAFYANGDDFKSPDPPFSDDGRRRNAQRFDFGLGESTFRVNTDMEQMFQFDPNGTFLPPDGNGFGELPYGWGVLPAP